MMKNYIFADIPQIQVTYANQVKVEDRTTITDSRTAVDILRESYQETGFDFVEKVKILLLNRANHVLGIADLFGGGSSSAVFDIKVILQYALVTNSSAIIIAHNHPSGNTTPSSSDIEITKKLKEAGKIMGINVFDHIIITSESHFSLADENYF